jgi:antirestriction protein ArdC
METKDIWSNLLVKAVNEPGIISKAYSAFHNYSIGNQILAMMQCQERKLEVGPLASYNNWKKLGRFVKKGQKAITLCMPITVKRTEKDQDGAEVERQFIVRFLFKPHWFVYCQTDGKEMEMPEVPGWDYKKALKTLNISEIPFEYLNGNCQGYALDGKIALNPMADHAFQTIIHEMAHNVLEHLKEDFDRSVIEMEAEATCLLVCSSFGLNTDESRGYIQSWYNKKEIPEYNARRIFNAADKILKAGI